MFSALLTVPWDRFLAPGATLVASFAGAWLAFQYQQRQKRDEVRRQRVSAGNRALATLLQQLNTLKSYQLDAVEPFRNSPGRAFQIKPTLPYNEQSLVYEVGSLDFMLTKKHAQVLMDLLLEEARYNETIKTINIRSDLHANVIQPLFASQGFVDGSDMTLDICRNVVGELNYVKLGELTDALITHVDTTVTSLQIMRDKLRGSLLEQFPDDEFIDFEVASTLPPSSIARAVADEQGD